MRQLLAVALALSLLAAPSPAAAQQISKSDLFAKSLQAAHQALEQYGTYDNTAALQRVVDIGYRIAQESGFTDFPFTFHLIDMPEPNAFALPGGQIFLTRGMLELELNDDMLGALLGHEIAHVVLRHGTRMQRRATLLNALSQALLVGVLIGASKSDGSNGTYHPLDPRSGGSNRGDVVQGTAAASMVVSELLLRSYSREFEDEADEEGQRSAAAAGFDPDGTRQLMATMNARIPESRQYGYWRTHPFLDDRAEAGLARRDLLKVQAPRQADRFRAATQEVLLDYIERQRPEPAVVPLLKEEALAAWPQGSLAEGLRLEKLLKLRDQEMTKPPLARDFGGLIGTFEEQIEQVRALTPDSPLLPRLTEQVAEIDKQRREVYAEAVNVLRGSVYQTDFLEIFASNYPEAPEFPEVALALGDSYSLLGRQTDAVTHYLRACEAGPENPAGQKARTGLRNLAPVLKQLGALQQLATQSEDPALSQLAGERLAQLASSYADLANGAEYLKRFPDGSHAATVTARLNQLADDLFVEMVLYQTVGDHVKALERIHKILSFAPLSPAAERLRERAVVADRAG